MAKWKTALLLMFAAGLCLPQTATENLNPEVRRVGERLACKCGSCNNTVGDCAMLGCGYAKPARAKIAGMQQSGMNDEQIVNSFVKEMGLVALAVPPAEGFHLLSWTMPFVVLLLGFGAILIYWKRFRKPVEATAKAPQVDERYRSRIEREMADLD
jgi:cytochrome c-type biogenesis protein CcmH/NrfF